MDNTVEVVIKGRDDAGPAFATATAEAKAFQKTMDEASRAEIAGHKASAAASTAHLRAFKALKAEAEDLASNSKGPGYLSLLFTKLGQSFLSAGTSAGGLASTLGLVVAPLAALAAILAGPLLASLAPITLGFVAFGAAAVGEIKKILEAHQKLQAAQEAYEKATTKRGRQSALKAEKEATDGLNASEKLLLGFLGQLGKQFSQLEKAVQPEVLGAFASGLRIIKDLMPTIKPLARAAGVAIDGFLQNIANWIEGPSGKKFLAWMAKDGPHAIETFGHVLWDVAQGIGRTFAFLRNAGNSWYRNVRKGTSDIAHAFSNTVHAAGNVVHAFGNLVHAGGNVVHAGGNVVHAFGNVVHAGGNVVHAFGNVIHAGGNVMHAFGNVVHAGGNVVNAIGNIISVIQSAISWFGRLASAANKALGGIPGKVLGFLGLASGGIVGAAAGGGPRGGMTWVGEQGPELVRLPLGSTVYPSGQSRMMAAQGGGGGDTYNVHVQVSPGTSPAETGRQIAYYLGEFKKRGGKIYAPAGY